jgi:hypothetical protein
MTVGQFLRTTDSEVLATLTLAHAAHFSALLSDQTLTWHADLHLLRNATQSLVERVTSASNWTLVFEFSIPRKEYRADIILLTQTEIVVLECKTTLHDSSAFEQVENYAVLLHYFHQPSFRRHIIPIVVSTDVPKSLSERAGLRAAQRELSFEALPSFWIAPTQAVRWGGLPAALLRLTGTDSPKLDAQEWIAGAYHPVPTIVEAARELRSGLKIREIAQCEAAEHEIDEVVETIQAIIKSAEENREHAICFLTGVPGSGKTLVGLSLAHLDDTGPGAIHFMSGNAPLVSVLQENFKKQAMRQKVPAKEAERQAQTLIENIHRFARAYSEDPQKRAPSNHVIIFDEAQRAWDRKQNKRKFNRDYSEPEMLLSLMERHTDWAVIVALVGGGQEINDGEAGLEEWGRALKQATRPWRIHASPEVLKGGASTAGRVLFGDVSAMHVEERPHLHLRTSNRSLRQEKLAAWVNAVLDGDAERAQSTTFGKYPIFLTRSLAATRKTLVAQALGESRLGLVASSGAQRLRAEGLEPGSSFHAAYPWHHWYLAGREDVRSSYQSEVHATEFEIQGLELDWVGVCWDGDFTWTGEQWLARDLRYTQPTRWGLVKQEDAKLFRRNAYRVLLTRARQGMVLFIPKGDASDATRSPEEFDRIADFLIRCGAVAL